MPLRHRQSLDRDATPNGKDIDVDIPHNCYHEDKDDFETIEQENHINLATLSWELDDLNPRVQAGEGKPAEALHCIECKLQTLSIALYPSATPECLSYVLQQCTETLCSAQTDKLCKHPTSGYTYLQW